MESEKQQPSTSSDGTPEVHPEVAQRLRLNAGSACLAMALKLQELGFSPLRLCDPHHFAVAHFHNHGKRCGSPGKAPLLLEWTPFQTRQPTIEEIKKWWSQYPIGNVGLVLGANAVRVDCDGPLSQQRLEEWSAGDLPDTWAFRTPNSPHPQYLYKWTGDTPAKTVTQKLDGTHSELKLLGFRGQTVIPPSRHPSGGFYEWLPGCSPDDIPLADAPAWLVDRMTTPKAKARSASASPRPPSSGEGTKEDQVILTSQLEKVTKAQLGARHDTRLTAGFTVGGLVASGRLPESAIDELVDVARNHSEKPDQAERDIQDSVRAGAEVPFVPSTQASAGDTDSGKTKEGASNPDVEGHESQKLSLSDIPLSDTYNAKRLFQKYGNIIKYCGFWEKTYIYSNGIGIWEPDYNKSIVELAKSVANDMFVEAKSLVAETSESDDKEARKRANVYLKHAVATHSLSKLHSMIEACLSEKALSVSHDAFDAHPYLLPCLNGVVDLKTGELLPHKPDYLFTKCLPIEFDPDATCPIWKRTLYTAMGGPIALDSLDDSSHVCGARYESHKRAKRFVRFLKEALGQALTGDVSEHMLVILWGHGRNGKGVILETLLELLASYATKLTQGVLMQNRFEPHPTEFTDLFGARFAITSETGKSRRLNLDLVKELCGGDTIKARRMREDFWKFTPTHHLFLSTNHKPAVDEDAAIWERIFLVPFERTFLHPSKLTDEQRHDPETPIRDLDLKDKLRNELPGILNWLLEGCLAWQENGLYIPDDVIAATAEYRKEEDVVSRFIEEECTTVEVKGMTLKPTPKAMFDRYKMWSENDEHERLSRKGFKDTLEKRGYKQTHDGTVRYWEGIYLNAANDADSNNTYGS